MLFSDVATGENINEAMISEGLAQVRGGGPEVARLQELEAQAKAAGKGIWSMDDRSMVICIFINIQ